MNARAGMASHAAMAAVMVGAWVAPNSTESAVANGDTRTVVFSNQHTNESGSFTYMVNGVYDQAVLEKLNWFMRDWRLDEPTKMDPHLFDIIWEVYRESGSHEPIDVLSGYRSPQTNAMLHRRSSQVAEHSQHMSGKAIDAHFIDVSTARIRDVAMRAQEGGVGFYPTGATPWVHIDSGSVRYWPRMSRDALARLFPDGKTVFIPADGKPMPGYDLAKAEIEQRGGQIQTAGGGGLFAWLFGARGGGADDAEEAAGQEAVIASSGGRGGRNAGAAPAVPAPTVEIADGGPTAVAKAKRNLPSGPTYASATPDAAPTSAPEPQSNPEVVATLDSPKVESDAAPDAGSDTPVKLRGPIAALYLAPLPPRRPTDLDTQLAALANVPLPPIRPADLRETTAPAALPPARPTDLAAEQPPESTASISQTPPIRPVSFIVGSASETNAGGARAIPAETAAYPPSLPKVITQGATLPRQALALAELPTSPVEDSSALLQRAAELTAPLPPMPIPAAAPEPAQAAAPVTSQPAASPAKLEGRRTGLIASIARMFGSLPFGVFAAKSSPQGANEPAKQQ